MFRFILTLVLIITLVFIIVLRSTASASMLPHAETGYFNNLHRDLSALEICLRLKPKTKTQNTFNKLQQKPSLNNFQQKNSFNNLQQKCQAELPNMLQKLQAQIIHLTNLGVFKFWPPVVWVTNRQDPHYYAKVLIAIWYLQLHPDLLTDKILVKLLSLRSHKALPIILTQELNKII